MKHTTRCDGCFWKVTGGKRKKEPPKPEGG